MNKQELLNIMKTRKDNKREELIGYIKYLIDDLFIQLGRLERFDGANVNGCGIIQSQGRKIDDLCKELNMLNQNIELIEELDD